MATAVEDREIAAVALRDELLQAVPYRAPATPAERRLAPIWRSALNLDRIGVDDDFFALGGESMAATMICAEIERLIGRRISPALLLKAPTIAAFAMAVDGNPRLEASQCLVQIRPGGDRPPLVLIHELDGQIMIARRLAWLLPADQPLYAIQARGQDGNVPRYDNGQALVEDYAEQIASGLGRQETYLGGFCMGGALAVGVSHGLAARGVACRGLILVDPPMETRVRDSKATQHALISEWHDTLAERMAPFMRWHPELAEYYGPNGEGLRHAQAAMRALLTAYANYAPQPSSVRATLIWSQERAEQRGGHSQPYALARGRYRAHVISSPRRFVDHKLMLREGAPVLAGLIRSALGLPPLERRGGGADLHDAAASRLEQSR